MERHLLKEFDYMNINGSPFLCLLCRGKVYNTPAQLQLHLVSTHGAENAPNKCALCELEFKEARHNTVDDNKRLIALYQIHINDHHLPYFELVEKLHYAGFPLLPESITEAAPKDNTQNRAYR